MSETQDKIPPPSEQHRLRDQVWHPVRDSGWLVLLAAALGGCLIGLLANPFPAWCDIPKEANIVCAREWLSAFSGYFGGVLTLIAAWIAFGPAKRAMELQEVPILESRIRFLDSLIRDYVDLEIKYASILPSINNIKEQENEIFTQYNQRLQLEITQLKLNNLKLMDKIWECPSRKLKIAIESNLNSIREVNFNIIKYNQPTNFNLKQINNEIRRAICLCRNITIIVHNTKSKIENRRYKIN